MEFNGTKVPIDAAAAALHVTQDFIRIGMQKGVLPIGSCFKMDGSTRTVYYISLSCCTTIQGMLMVRQFGAVDLVR